MDIVTQAISSLLVVTGAAFAAGCIGAAFAFGVVLVCRSMNWAPVNVEINLNDHRDCGY